MTGFISINNQKLIEIKLNEFKYYLGRASLLIFNNQNILNTQFRLQRQRTYIQN